MKTFTFSGTGYQSMLYRYELSLTTEQLAKHTDLSVEEVEAMTEEQIKAFMQDKIYIIDSLVDECDSSSFVDDAEINLEWPCCTQYDSDINFDLEVKE